MVFLVFQYLGVIKSLCNFASHSWRLFFTWLFVARSCGYSSSNICNSLGRTLASNAECCVILVIKKCFFCMRFRKFVTRVWGNQIFLILLIFNILSNGAALAMYKDALSIFSVLGISALSATVESCLCHLFTNQKVRKCVLWFFVVLHLLMAVVDYFLIANFQSFLNTDTLCIIAETTLIEIKSFFSTYLDFTSVLVVIISVFLIF